MAEKRFGKSNTKVKCKDKNIPENVKTLEKHIIIIIIIIIMVIFKCYFSGELIALS